MSTPVPAAALSLVRDFGVNPAMVVTWVATGVVGGPVFGAAGWCWRRVRSLRWTWLSAALMGGVFLSEGAVGYGIYLHYAGDAVIPCALGALLVAALGATAPATRAVRAPARGIGSARVWLLLVLPLCEWRARERGHRADGRRVRRPPAPAEPGSPGGGPGEVHER